MILKQVNDPTSDIQPWFQPLMSYFGPQLNINKKNKVTDGLE